MRDITTSPDDIFAHYGRSVIQEYASPVEKREAFLPLPPRAVTDEPVGILGAGVGGLYTALILQSLNVSYEIIEASNRTGGRMFTHKFSDGGLYDYFDVGAMRYPLPPLDDKGDYRPGVMQRLGWLFKYIGLQDKLINYLYTSDKSPGFQYFNGIRVRIGNQSDFDAPALGINQSYITAGTKAIVADVVKPFAQALYGDLKYNTRTGWDKMLSVHAHSTRSYMSFAYMPSESLGIPEEHLSTRVINWLETFDKSTGWYDRGFNERVLEAIAYGQTDEGVVDWKCIDGGSHVLPDAMVEAIQAGGGVIKFNAPVSSIALTNPDSENSTMTVTAAGQQHIYSHVISTLPMPNLRTIDLTGSKLDAVQTNALRVSNYGPSIKIGIRFSEAWWTTGQDRDGNNFDIVGGQSYTDLPIRTVIYPSYGVYSETPSTILIASYCWTYDAERLSALIGTGQQEYEDQLKALVLANLAAIHNVDVSYLTTRFRDMYSWAWNHDPLTGGAFAFFGPGGFGDMYTALSRPAADNKLHFAGEALSIRHAWVVGALDSAWRAVYSYLFFTDPSKLDVFFALWGKNAEWFEQYPDTAKPRSNSLVEVLTSCSRWVVGALDSAWRGMYSYLLFTDPSKLDVFYTSWGKNAEWSEKEPDTGKPSDSLLERYLRNAQRA